MPGKSGAPDRSRPMRLWRISSLTERIWYPLAFSSAMVLGRSIQAKVEIYLAAGLAPRGASSAAKCFPRCKKRSRADIHCIKSGREARPVGVEIEGRPGGEKSTPAEL